jgi:hypothetical protein
MTMATATTGGTAPIGGTAPTGSTGSNGDMASGGAPGSPISAGDCSMVPASASKTSSLLCFGILALLAVRRRRNLRLRDCAGNFELNSDT